MLIFVSSEERWDPKTTRYHTPKLISNLKRDYQSGTPSLVSYKKFDTAAAEGMVYKFGTAAFNAMTQNVALGADNFLSTVKNYALTNGSMFEQYERGSGKSTGARDLTWSHAALISAARAKAGTPSA
ncbi:Six-hairpin glycosidase-like protein [Mucor mucedo]|uniref:Six-hairpin glycosidase-like protein n=1 Tax=Mucor mucedo TaxID=29922 RepID=UPI00221ECA08|nr:Six-hairpin glycosidase-like protein [Mucor mucedo]KAI7876814.1 Six-hairpin glycosidase-like protein [Mucor mucedo]